MVRDLAELEKEEERLADLLLDLDYEPEVENPPSRLIDPQIANKKKKSKNTTSGS